MRNLTQMLMNKEITINNVHYYYKTYLVDKDDQLELTFVYHIEEHTVENRKYAKIIGVKDDQNQDITNVYRMLTDDTDFSIIEEEIKFSTNL